MAINSTMTDPSSSTTSSAESSHFVAGVVAIEEPVADIINKPSATVAVETMVDNTEINVTTEDTSTNGDLPKDKASDEVDLEDTKVLNVEDGVNGHDMTKEESKKRPSPSKEGELDPEAKKVAVESESTTKDEDNDEPIVLEDDNNEAVDDENEPEVIDGDENAAEEDDEEPPAET